MLKKAHTYIESVLLPKHTMEVSSNMIHSLIVYEFESRGCETDKLWIESPMSVYAINPKHNHPNKYDRIKLDY